MAALPGWTAPTSRTIPRRVMPTRPLPRATRHSSASATIRFPDPAWIMGQRLSDTGDEAGINDREVRVRPLIVQPGSHAGGRWRAVAPAAPPDPSRSPPRTVPSRVAPASIIASAAARSRTPPDAFTPSTGRPCGASARHPRASRRRGRTRSTFTNATPRSRHISHTRTFSSSVSSPFPGSP